MTTRMALVEARALIEAGWVQCHDHQVIEGRSCYCAEGALFAIGGYRSVYLESWRALRNAIGCDRIVFWNDAPGRTQAQVLAAFDRAIIAVTP